MVLEWKNAGSHQGTRMHTPGRRVIAGGREDDGSCGGCKRELSHVACPPRRRANVKTTRPVVTDVEDSFVQVRICPLSYTFYLTYTLFEGFHKQGNVGALALPASRSPSPCRYARRWLRRWKAPVTDLQNATPNPTPLSSR